MPLSDGHDMTRELIEIRGKRVKDIQFGQQFIAILTEGMLWVELHLLYWTSWIHFTNME